VNKALLDTDILSEIAKGINQDRRPQRNHIPAGS
jgi:hypothetical protein